MKGKEESVSLRWTDGPASVTASSVCGHGNSSCQPRHVFSAQGRGFGESRICRNMCGGARTDVQAGVRLGGPDVLKGDPGSWLLKSWHLSLELGAWSRLSLDRGMRQAQGWRQFQKLEETGTWKGKVPGKGPSAPPQETAGFHKVGVGGLQAGRREVLGPRKWGSWEIGKLVSSEEVKSFAIGEVVEKGSVLSFISIWPTLWHSCSSLSKIGYT